MRPCAGLAPVYDDTAAIVHSAYQRIIAVPLDPHWTRACCGTFAAVVMQMAEVLAEGTVAER